MKKQSKISTLKTMAAIYSWIGISCASYLLLVGAADEFTGNLAMLVKFIIFASFVYSKNNWRMLVLCLSGISMIFTLTTLNGILSVVDLIGFSLVFWYALKERK